MILIIFVSAFQLFLCAFTPLNKTVVHNTFVVYCRFQNKQHKKDVITVIVTVFGRRSVIVGHLTHTIDKQ